MLGAIRRLFSRLLPAVVVSGLRRLLSRLPRVAVTALRRLLSRLPCVAVTALRRLLSRLLHAVVNALRRLPQWLPHAVLRRLATLGRLYMRLSWGVATAHRRQVFLPQPLPCRCLRVRLHNYVACLMLGILHQQFLQIL